MAEEGIVDSEELSAEAHFAWSFELAKRAEILLASGKKLSPVTEAHALEILMDFYKAMADIYGCKDRDSVLNNRHRWADDYRKGIDELLSKQLIEVERNGLGEWEVTKLHQRKLRTTIIVGPND